MGHIAAKAVLLKDGSSIVVRSGGENDAQALLDLLDVTLRDGAGQVAEPGEMPLSLDSGLGARHARAGGGNFSSLLNITAR